jgi:RHS repeat-associated protein
LGVFLSRVRREEHRAPPLALAYNSKEQTTSMTSLTGTNSTAMTYAGPNQLERGTFGSTTETTSALGVNADTDSSGTDYYRRDDEGRLVSTKRASGSIHYFAFDSIGSVTALINNSGSVVQSYSYDPYGGTTANISGGPSNPWRFASTYQDPTGFYKMGARYYSPGLMRWTQQDPLEGPDDFNQVNRFAYVGGDPVNKVDPTGQSVSSWFNRCVLSKGDWTCIGISNSSVEAFEHPLSETLSTSANCGVGLAIGRLGGPLAARSAIVSCVSGALAIPRF